LRLLLKEQLQGQGWQVRTLDVQEDYVYLLADVPGENPSDEIISDLKRRSAEIIRTSSPQSDTEPVWADSYLVLTPGRTIDTEEIQEFIRFVRE
jgi:REP element-mobilizing transposase RayT